MSGLNVRQTWPSKWRASSPLRAATVVWGPWRGGQVRAVNGSQITIRFHREQHRTADTVVAASLFTQSPPAVGDPCQLRLDDAGTVLEVHDAPPVDLAAEAAYQRDGVTFSPGRIQQQPGLSEVYPW